MAGWGFNPAVILREARRALVRNKLRSALTVLGVTIGIGAVICVVAIGTAGSQQIQEQLTNMGDNVIWIEAGSVNRLGIRTGGHQTKTLTLGDEQAILQQIPFVKSCSPQVDSRAQVVYGNQNWSTVYRGVSPEYFEIRRWKLVQGVPFSQSDVQRAAGVCVIGWTVKDQLFGSEDPLGKVLRIKDVPCTVSGILQPKGQSAFGQDQDDQVLLPYTTAQRKIKGITWVDDIMCSAVSAEALDPGTDQTIALLRERHHIFPGQEDDFNVRRPEEIVQARLEASRTFTLLLVSIASVSLLVGGIGIMNVMLVSVTERTREIGVRMAVGATDQQIQIQFLGEAVMLSLCGGFAGVFLGIGGSVMLGRMLEWPMEVSLEAILIATLFSVGVGVFFGYYPARRASALDPIETLRYE